MNEKLCEIVVGYQKLMDALIDESCANLNGWNGHQRSSGYIKRILKTPKESFGYGANHMVEILSKRYSLFKSEKISLRWYSCGNDVRTYNDELVHDGIEVWCKEDIPQTDVSQFLRQFRDSLPLIVANLFGPEIWRKGSFGDLPVIYQRSWEASIQYTVFYQDAKKSRSTGTIYIATLAHDTPYMHELVIFYGVVLRLLVFGWSESMPHEYIYDKRIGFIIDKKREAEVREIIGLKRL